VAVNCCVVPGAMLAGVDGVTTIDDTCSMFRVVVPIMPLETAVIVVVPMLACAFAKPGDPTALLMVATLVFVEFHVAVVVMFCMLPFENVPMAVSCAVVPGAMLEFTGVTDIETSVGAGPGDDPVGPQPCRKIEKSTAVVARLMLIHTRNLLFMTHLQHVK
jgi:hypothetical protein